MCAAFAVGNLISAFTVGTEDAALTAELQAGSEEAFARLIAQYQTSIYSLISRILTDPSDAADITQEVFVKVFRKIGSFHGESSLRTWSYRIARNEASNQRRWWVRHKQRDVPIDQELTENGSASPVTLKDMLVDPAESPFDMVERAENRERVERALKTVPEPYRTTLILRDIEGFVYEEVAEMQGVSLGTVKSRLVRGRACLKALLNVPRPGAYPAELAGIEMPLGEEAR